MNWKDLLFVHAVLIILSFFATAGIVWVACWAFGFTWSWKLSIAVWLIEALLRSIFKHN